MSIPHTLSSTRRQSMDSRSLELHPSALSPPEYKAFGGYLAALTDRPSVTPSSLNPDSKFHRTALKNCVIHRIGAAKEDADDLLLAIQPTVARPLNLGQTFAFFRLANHARTAKPDRSGQRRQTDLALVFVPCSPFDPKAQKPKVPPPVPARNRKVSLQVPQDAGQNGVEGLSIDASRAIASSSRQSLPARFPLDPFQGSLEKKGRAVSGTSFVELQHASNNPFRQRIVSGPVIVAKPPPPLPPRKTDPSDTSGSVRRQKRGPSVSSSSSLLSYHTSGARPSPLIQQSLMAAEHQSSLYKKSEPQLSIIRQSSEASPSKQATRSVSASHKNAELIRRVSNAVKESEEEEKPHAPPRRTASTRVKSKIETLARPLLDVDPDITPWSCVDLVQGQPGQRMYAMIILNQPITRKDIFLRAWSASELHFCADGGANRLYDIFNTEQRSSCLPTLIKGDLDSLRVDVREYYANKGVSIKHDGSEYATDLQKCIDEVEAVEQATGVKYDLLLMGGLSGRVDQTVHVMSLLHKLRKTRSRSFILSSESLAWVLDEGKHVIEIDHTTMGQTCGILPVGVDSAYVKTEGLKWNLDWETSFDGDVSSSNHLLPSEPLVHLTTNKPIMWCIEIKPNLPSLANTSSARRQKSLSSLPTSHRGTDELSRGIRDLSMGMAKAAEGLGRELDKLQSARSNRNSSAGPSRTERDRPMSCDYDERPVSSTDRLREESGWTRLD